MSTRKKSANSGIDALLGFNFQRNCALFLLLDEYDRFKGREFFLCIEHHDDFLFCYRTDCLSNIEEIHSYQAKKLSTKAWTINGRFSEIVAKLLEVGNDLRNDTASKCQSYAHELTFISNSDVELKYTPNSNEKVNGKKEVVTLLNEQNCKCKYESIPSDIRSKIADKTKAFCSDVNMSYHKSELDNLHIQWIDFPRTGNAQKDQLVGLMKRKFPHVSDSLAAVELLLSLFRDVELIYNQGKIISLLDNSKRVEGNDIKKAIEVIETEQKIFKIWRQYSVTLIPKFRIPIGIQNNDENYISNTFELLKDMNNHEHQLIKNFVKDNDYSMDYYSYDEIFESYILNVKSVNNINLPDIDIFFSVLCAFVEYYCRNIK